MSLLAVFEEPMLPPITTKRAIFFSFLPVCVIAGDWVTALFVSVTFPVNKIDVNYFLSNCNQAIALTYHLTNLHGNAMSSPLNKHSSILKQLQDIRFYPLCMPLQKYFTLQ